MNSNTIIVVVVVIIIIISQVSNDTTTSAMAVRLYASEGRSAQEDTAHISRATRRYYYNYY